MAEVVATIIGRGTYLTGGGPAPRPDRGELILSAIYDDVRHKLNPNDDDCWHCGGEGYTSDCFEEWACIDPESGCEECTRRCPECAMYQAKVTRAVRVEVLRMLDIDTAIAFLRNQGKWVDKITRDRVLMNLHAGRVAHNEFTDIERADSACWVEGLL